VGTKENQENIKSADFRPRVEIDNSQIKTTVVQNCAMSLLRDLELGKDGVYIKL